MKNKYTSFTRSPLLELFLYCISLFPSILQGQTNRNAYDAVKDSIVVNYNTKNYKNLYGLFDTTFTNTVSESRLTNFLQGNQNSGKIVATSFLSEKNGKASYLLQTELRDLILDLQLTNFNKISSFGLRNKPAELLATPPAVQSNNRKTSDLDKMVDSIAMDYFRNANANSLTIGIIINGRHYLYFYGGKDKGEPALPDPNTLYEIGSITKTFTATILAQAVLDKKVSLQDDIRKYLGGDFNNLAYNDVPITLQDLANHTSGLPSLPADMSDYPDYDPVNPEAHYDSIKFFKALMNFKPDTVPGFKFSYSNWGISLLGHILEKVYRQPLPSLYKQFITTPMHMSRTSFAIAKTDKNIAFPHSENGRRLPVTDQGYFYPAGGLCTSVHDMMNYMEAQLLEKNTAVTLTHLPTCNNMGLGWGVVKKNGIRHLEHNGGEQGSTAHVSVFPEINSGCVVFANNRINLGKVITGIQKILKNEFTGF